MRAKNIYIILFYRLIKILPLTPLSLANRASPSLSQRPCLSLSLSHSLSSHLWISSLRSLKAHHSGLFPRHRPKSQAADPHLRPTPPPTSFPLIRPTPTLSSLSCKPLLPPICLFSLPWLSFFLFYFILLLFSYGFGGCGGGGWFWLW